MMAASAVISDDGGRLLLVRDPHGFWSGVGGFVEAGETPEQTIVREVKEELGVESEVVRHFRPLFAWNVAQPDSTPVSFVLFPHRVRLASLDFRPQPEEVTDLAWVLPEEFRGFDMLPHIRSTFDRCLPEWLGG
jgi:8-oxo-dGTP pyrophosphatase MutT (NUDIX family)